MVNDGLRFLPGHLDRAAQERLLADVLAAIGPAPFYRPSMPRTGRPLSVEMTNLGSHGWVADRAGYRYQADHPVTGGPWPEIPETVLDLWRELTGVPFDPECCLVNRYLGGAKLGLHRDEDEETFAAPVVSVSLGDTCLFRVGGLGRKDPTSTMRLASGDVVVLGGAARLFYHGVDRIHAGSSTLVPGGGRINLTLRRVTDPQ